MNAPKRTNSPVIPRANAKVEAQSVQWETNAKRGESHRDPREESDQEKETQSSTQSLQSPSN